MNDLISRQVAIDALTENKEMINAVLDSLTLDYNTRRNQEQRRGQINEDIEAIKALPSAQTDVPDINVGDMISIKKVRYKLTALVNELEEIFANIRERNEDDSVCGLCEYDGAYIGQSGEWCNECPGFEKADCFKLKDKYREEWVTIDE